MLFYTLMSLPNYEVIMKSKKMSKTTKMQKSSVKKVSAPSKKLSSVNKSFSKSEILSNVAQLTELSQKQVRSVIDSLHQIIELHVKKAGPGTFVMPGLLKIQVINKPATKARKGINPFTGEETMFKAKPARRVVKVRPLKGLKEMV